MADTSSTQVLESYLAEKQPPLRVWLGPVAGRTCMEMLHDELGPDAELRVLPPGPDDAPLTGPAVPVLTPEDIQGPHNKALLWLSREASPGRPVVYGGARNKDTLLEAINVWHVFRLLPEETPRKALAVAVRKAHEAISVEVALQGCREDLDHQCQRLQSTIEELRATQGELFRTERLAIVAAVSEALQLRLSDQFRALDAFMQAVRGLQGAGQELIEPLEITVEGIRSIAALLDEMFSFAGAGDSAANIQREPLDLLVVRAADFLRHDPQIKRRHLDVRCESGAWVEVDRYRTYLVLMNFLRNAVQATKEDDRILVRTRKEQTHAVVEVEDTGQGMDKKTLAQIYTPFFSTRGSQGAGLGLRLSRTVVERHGGKVQCISTPGEGTIFAIRLPLAAD